jgi:predicted nucleic acid-binding protein
MGPRADSAVFVDTNVLVYSSFSASPLHALARTNLSELEARGTVLWASRQVLREFIAVTTRSGAVFPHIVDRRKLRVFGCQEEGW